MQRDSSLDQFVARAARSSSLRLGALTNGLSSSNSVTCYEDTMPSSFGGQAGMVPVIISSPIMRTQLALWSNISPIFCGSKTRRPINGATGVMSRSGTTFGAHSRQTISGSMASDWQRDPPSTMIEQGPAEYWSGGVVEYWSDGAKVSGGNSSTPLLQHSITPCSIAPSLHHSVILLMPA
jgi:hypothetical protein